MLSALSSAATAATSLSHYGPGPGAGGFGWLWLLVPLFWIAFFVLLVAFVGRRLRRGGANWQMHGPSPEQTLGDRYARGEVDEQEYRSRLEVLRSNQPQRR